MVHQAKHDPQRMAPLRQAGRPQNLTRTRMHRLSSMGNFMVRRNMVSGQKMTKHERPLQQSLDRARALTAIEHICRVVRNVPEATILVTEGACRRRKHWSKRAERLGGDRVGHGGTQPNPS